MSAEKMRENSSGLSQIKLSAMNYLSYRDHSVWELRQKLESKYPENDSLIDQVIDTLSMENLVSDSRFSESYLRVRSEKGFGPNKIKYELRHKKGISASIIELAFEYSDVNWYKIMARVIQKKYNITAHVNRTKQSHFLYQRGFSFEQINNFFQHFNNEHHEINS